MTDDQLLTASERSRLGMLTQQLNMLAASISGRDSFGLRVAAAIAIDAADALNEIAARWEDENVHGI